MLEGAKAVDRQQPKSVTEAPTAAIFAAVLTVATAANAAVYTAMAANASDFRRIVWSIIVLVQLLAVVTISRKWRYGRVVRMGLAFGLLGGWGVAYILMM